MRPRLLALLCAAVTGLAACVTTAPWCDEITFLDSARAFLASGDWHSEAFYCVNANLHGLLAAAVSAALGTPSHACSVLLCTVLTLGALETFRRLLVTCGRYPATPAAAALLTVLLWLTPSVPVPSVPTPASCP